MPCSDFRSALLPASTFILTATLAFSGCSLNGHPDNRMAVYDTLNQHDLRSLTVSQDRSAGTMTLSGIVGSSDRKQQAENLARQAAPTYTVVDHIRVESAGLQGEMRAAQQDAQLDSAIESRYKVTLASHRDLRDVHFTAYNQTLTLKGSVKTYKERQEAEDLAKKLPRVEHVVNEIQINGGTPSPANS
jgi:hyperosmotically inducible protein